MHTFSAILNAERESIAIANANTIATPEPAVPVEGSELTLTKHELPPDELSKRILGFVVEKKSYEKLKEFIPSEVPTDEDAYIRDFVETTECDTRVYSLQGHTVRVLVPEEYAQKLDIVRQRRLGQIALLPVELIGYLNRALPEDIMAMVDELPNRNYIADISLVDWPNSRDKLTRALRKSDTFVSDASTMPDGQVMLYKFDVGDWLRTTLFHEWNHNLQRQFMKEVETVWNAAVNLEWFVWVNRPYALVDKGEHWAVFGEAILQKDGPQYAEVVNKLGPMRALVWTMALGKALDVVPAAERSCYHDIWVARVAYATKNATALATTKATELLTQAQCVDAYLKGLSAPTLAAVA